jgi:hypothetical protein
MEPMLLMMNCLLQVWFVAVTESDTRSGIVRSAVKANAGSGKGKLRITQVHVVGLTSVAAASGPQTTPIKTPGTAGPATVKENSQLRPASTAPLNSGSSKVDKQQALSTQPAAQVQVTGGSAVQTAKSVWDANAGVLRVVDIDLDVGLPISIKWSL